jgi:hypothetical protein
MSNHNDFTETERVIAEGLFKLFSSEAELREQIEAIHPTSPHVAELLRRMMAKQAESAALQQGQKHNG